VEPWPFGTGGQHVKGALEIRRHHRTPGLSDDHTETSLGLSQTAIETPSSLWKNHHDLPRLNQGNRLIDCLTIQPSHRKITFKPGINKSLRPRYHARLNMPHPSNGMSK
jgi:hypothetical protein